ncbi:MAG: DUF99 family protein [Candidatus Altiarchaeota archaeon]
MDAKFYSIKDEIRIVGFDDGPFKRGQKDVLVVGAVFRGGLWMDGVISTKASVDGLDATEKLSSLMKSCRFKDLRVIMLDGIAFGGFNIVDIHALNRESKMPVIVVTRDMPDFKEIESALKHLTDFDTRWKLIQGAGEPKPVETMKGKKVFIQSAGIRFEDAEKIVKLSATRSLLPEPIRVAHLIAQGIVLGQSKGKA